MDSILKRTNSTSLKTMTGKSLTLSSSNSSSSYSKMTKTSSTLNCKKYEPKNKNPSPLMSNKKPGKWKKVWRIVVWVDTSKQRWLYLFTVDNKIANNGDSFERNNLLAYYICRKKIDSKIRYYFEHTYKSSGQTDV